jgi:preprotein translocase SecE subunit
MHRTKMIADLKTEFKKISWLSKPEIIRQSRIVLLSIISVGFLVYAADVLLQMLLFVISWLLKFLIG